MSAPWTFSRIDTGHRQKDGFGYVSDAEGRDILHVGERSLSEAENVAIGALSAAAPDMLAACRDTLKKLESVSWLSELPFEVKALRAAIAKATGGSDA